MQTGFNVQSMNLLSSISYCCAAQKRRYSSTAVEFPKFDDLKPHIWGFPPSFPSGAGARARVTYVQGRENDRQLTENRPPYSTPARHLRPTIRVPNPYQRPQKSQSSARMERTTRPSRNYEYFANHLGVIWESLAPS